MTKSELIDVVSGHLHAEQHVDAAREIARFSGAPIGAIDNKDTALEWCNSLLFSLLNSNNYAAAAHILWGRAQFDPRPRATQMVWKGIEEGNSVMLMGAASQSKSYSGGVWLMLDWLRDPLWTNVNLVGPSEDHLKDNLFSHLVALHKSASLPMPGIVGDLFIGMDTKNRRGAIRGIVIPLGKRPSGRLQGRKRVPRPSPHPSLGPMSRIRFMLDEVEKIPIGVWKDVDNIFSNLTNDVDGFKIICAFNPEDPSGPVAQRCEPVMGWESFDKENHHVWKSKRGWDVVRLDAKYSENVMQQKEIFPGLQTYEGYKRIIQNAGGDNSPGADTMARACFPAGGAAFSVIPSMLLGRAKGEFIFAETPEPVAGADLALEGKDSAEICVGRFGRAVGVKYPPSFDQPNGRQLLFADKNGNRVFRWAAQVDEIVPMPKADTVVMADNIKKFCNLRGIKPGCLMVDRTGNGAGVHDTLKSVWSQEVRGVNYSENATERKILAEDTKNAKEEYGRAVGELWFALKKWAEFNFLKIKPSALSEELAQEVTGRRYATGKITQVETKGEYASRGNPSPNKADSLTLFIHAIRAAFRVVPSSAEDLEGTVTTTLQSTANDPVPQWEDSTNRLDYLDSNQVDDHMN
jgi:hypothetical protein